ncbi:hypothetical protein [Erythrobacter sp. YT30]|uniref:hypothetical protein n=1 Tax=Erythrobacter sp. YT30 TaxID=1735012 RepID=UPI00076CDB21|nr:hypothetical protein [Erythrobacter sp. YT30]KWV91612.1 hypothetical protein AUC45_10350 [Erythrobacter sp. YT30]
MTNFSKIAAIPLLAAAATFSLAVPATAGGDDNKTIIVTKMSEWKEQANKKLNRALTRNPTNRVGVPAEGIVQLGFRLDEKGRATDFKVLTNTANRPAVETAEYALKRMGDMRDAPVADAQKALFRADIVFADDLATRNKLLAELNQKRSTQVASNAGGPVYIAFGS